MHERESGSMFFFFTKNNGDSTAGLFKIDGVLSVISRQGMTLTKYDLYEKSNLALEPWRRKRDIRTMQVYFYGNQALQNKLKDENIIVLLFKKSHFRLENVLPIKYRYIDIVSCASKKT